MKPPRMAASIAKNLAISRRCLVEGCHKPVFEFGALCKAHHKKKLTWGHPKGRGILLRDLRRYRRVVSEFLSDNEQHPAVVEAVEFFKLLLETGAKFAAGRRPSRLKVNDVLWHHLAHARAEGATGLELLTEALVVSAYLDQHPRAARSPEHERFLIARRVLQVRAWRVSRWVNGEEGRHRYKALGTRMLRDLAQMVSSRVGLFLFRAAKEVNRRHLGPPAYFEPVGIDAPFRTQPDTPPASSTEEAHDQQ